MCAQNVPIMAPRGLRAVFILTCARRWQRFEEQNRDMASPLAEVKQDLWRLLGLQVVVTFALMSFYDITQVM